MVLASSRFEQGKTYNLAKARYELSNRHNGEMPKDYLFCAKQNKVIISFFSSNRGDRYLRCANNLMIDENIAYTSLLECIAL